MSGSRKSAPFHPQKPELGRRELPFSREIYIDADDFMEDAPNKYFRLKPGGSVRLRYGYIIDFERLVKDDAGNIVEVHCTYDPATRSGQDKSGRKVKGVIHWLSAPHALDATVRLYDRLFTVPGPDSHEAPFTDFINPDSLETLSQAKVEPSLANAKASDTFQFERQGYFVADDILHGKHNKLVFNRTVTLRDSWGKEQKKP